MNPIYRVNTELDIPIYQQLVDAIKDSIKKGELAFGEKLPTVQQMIDELGIARGTVKRAYDELERAGLIEKAQGRGTFVCYQPSNSGSRKEQAMLAIDNMFKQLEDMGFSSSEVNIFLNLKLREWTEQESHIKVAAVECNPENLSSISEQLRHIQEIDLYAYTLDTIKQYPYKINEDFDLVITTASHAPYLESIISNDKNLVRVALRPSTRFLSHIIRLASNKKVGIIGYSVRFANLIYNTCQTYAEDAELCDPVALETGARINDYLDNIDVLLVPKFYEKNFQSQTIEAMRNFSGEIIECYYELDEGSVLYLERKIKRFLEKKS